MTLSISSIKKLIHSHHFKTSFLMLLFISHCFLLLIAVIWQGQYRAATEEKAEFHLLRLISHSERTLSTAKDNALFAGALPSVQNALLSPFPSLDQLIALDSDLTPFVNMMAYESFTLFFAQSDIIYDSKGSLYQTENFYNPELLSRFASRQSQEYWEYGFPYERFYEGNTPRHVLTYVHSLPLYSVEKYGFISVNLPLSGLISYFDQASAGLPERLALFFEDKLLWSNDKSLSLYDSQILASSAHEAKPQITLTSSAYPALRGEVYLPLHYIVRQALSYFPFLALFYLLLLVLNFYGTVAYSCYHLHRFDLFLNKIGMDGRRILSGELSEKSGFVFSRRLASTAQNTPSSSDYDEFQLLHQAAEHFQSEISHIKDSIAQNKPLLQERLLTEILYHHVEVDAIPPEYAEYDISFPYPYFCIILIAIQEIESVPTTTIKEELKLVTKQNAHELFSALGKVYSIYSEKDNLLFLLNTGENERLKDRLFSLASALKNGMKSSLGFHLLFSVAFCDAENPVPYYAWTKARKNLIFTSGASDSFILFSQQEQYASSLMPSVIFQITQAIIDKDLRRLNQVVEHFYEQNLPESTPLPTARKTLLLAASSIFSALLEMDIFSPIEEMNRMFRQIEQSQKLSQSKELFQAYLTSLIDAESKISRDAHEYIEKTIAYLKEHFSEPITIPQIAENANISPIYLNKLFKLSTGKTLSEYLNFYRMEKSREMLKNSDMTINDISKALGYNDVRSYIRFFKKFYDVTPNHYRKSPE